MVGRYVDGGSLIAIEMGTVTSPQITTIRLIMDPDGEMDLYNIELIAQDTTSDANKVKIQIPSQNVVSYGKKFTVAETKHYNPFAFKTDGSTAWASGAHNGTAWPIGTGSSTNIDTATSLGLAAWVSTNYYKPYNGGRVVKWVASDGTIKTSVNMMPPNAQNIAGSAITAKANAAVANNTYLPTFTGAIDHSQAEVAKTFHWREFGNGSANNGTTGAYADASMLNGYDDIAYVMDDGLTSLSADDVNNSGGHEGFHLQGDGDDAYITFIGTGIALKTYAGTHGGTDSWKWYIDGVEVKNFTSGYVHSGEFLVAAQNLSYGTHILQVERVTANTFGLQIQEATFHQPKMPPIPEDAVVIADYMLMADFVGLPTSVSSNFTVSKGVRVSSATRDSFYHSNTAFVSQSGNAIKPQYPYGFEPPYNSAVHSQKITFFADNIALNVYNQGISNTLDVDSSTNVTKIHTDAASHEGDKYTYNGTALVMGVHTAQLNVPSGGYPSSAGFEVPTPIHTSSHYQSFETPFLHELVGGDRNMEQTNLVVTPDGKTWDEVTRDVSYIGRDVVNCTVYDADIGDSWADVIWNMWRGTYANVMYYNKDWAIAYNSMICLVDGTYSFTGHLSSDGNTSALAFFFNDSEMMEMFENGTANTAMVGRRIINCKRGDTIRTRTKNNSTDVQRRSNFLIERL